MKFAVIVTLLAFLALALAVRTKTPIPQADYVPAPPVKILPIGEPKVIPGKMVTEGTEIPSSTLGLELLAKVEALQEGDADGDGDIDANDDINQVPLVADQTCFLPTFPSSNKVPINVTLGTGIGAVTYKNSAFLIGGTSDPFAYEKLISGNTINYVNNEVYEFVFAESKWNKRANIPHGYNLAYSSSVQYSFPACDKTVTKKRSIAKELIASALAGNSSFAQEFNQTEMCGKDTIVVFGGTNGTSTLNSVLYYVVAEDRWVQGPKISAFTMDFDPVELRLAGHTATVFSHYMIVIGGLQFQYGNNVQPKWSNNIWLFDFNTQLWRKVELANGDQFPALAYHTAELYCSNSYRTDCGNAKGATAELYIYGGIKANGTINNNKYILSIEPEGRVVTEMDKHSMMNITVTYAEANSTTVAVDCKNGTFGHGSTVNKDSIYYFGGAHYNQQLTTRFPFPGGAPVVDTSFKILNELWRYDIKQDQWYNITEFNPWITAKFGAIVLEHEDKIYFVGGFDEKLGVSSGVHVMDVSTCEYKFVPSCAPGWSGKRCAIPLCSCGCGGPNVGVCVAPDVCQCMNGFTGAACEQHACNDVYGYDLVSLNSVLFYPQAAGNLHARVQETIQRLKFVQNNLPSYNAASVDLSLNSIAKAVHQYNQDGLEAYMNDTRKMLTFFTTL